MNKNIAFTTMLTSLLMILPIHFLIAAEPLTPSQAKQQAKITPLTATPSRSEWLKVSTNTSAAKIIIEEYKQLLIKKINTAAESEIEYLSKSSTDRTVQQEIKNTVLERNEQIKSIGTLAKNNPNLVFESIDGTQWQFFRDGENSLPTRLQKILIPEAKNYAVDAWVYCREKTDACTRLIKATSIIKPIAPTMRTENAEQHSEWLRIARAEPCDAKLPIKMPGPQYPPEAQREFMSGTVVLQFNFNACGDVLNAWVAKSSQHPVLDSSALKAISGWRVDGASLSRSSIGEGLAQVPVKFIAEE
jgi:TonB family protein